MRETYLPALRTSLVNAIKDEAIAALLASGRRRVNFMNAHCFSVMARDRQYAAAVNSADVLLPDGIGVALAGKMTGHALSANLNGTDFIHALLQEAAKWASRFICLAGRPALRSRRLKR